MLARLSVAFVALLASANALYHGTDSSQLVSEATFAKAKGEGFIKEVIRGYEEACSVGGKVDPNFVQTYKNARAAGITNIDAYLFPCTGTGNPCKSYATQIAEIGQTFTANKMQIGTLWLDIEQDSTCGAWNYGTSGNLAQAKALVQAAKNSGFKFGIYSSPGEWGNIFGSQSVVVDNSVPLWFATYDNDDSSVTLKSPFGGWTTAVGKQYTDQSASGLFDLNVWA